MTMSSCLWMILWTLSLFVFFFFQAEDGIRDLTVTGVQTCALPISLMAARICGPVSGTSLAVAASAQNTAPAAVRRARCRVGLLGRRCGTELKVFFVISQPSARPMQIGRAHV